MNTCIDCGKEIFKGHGQKRCSKCQQKFTKERQRKYNTKYYKSHNAPKHGLYQYAKFVKTLTTDEIRALVSTYKNHLKYTKYYSEEWYLLRSKIKTLTTEYSSREEAEEKIKAYNDDKEREEILKSGEYEY